LPAARRAKAQLRAAAASGNGASGDSCPRAASSGEIRAPAQAANGNSSRAVKSDEGAPGGASAQRRACRTSEVKAFQGSRAAKEFHAGSRTCKASFSPSFSWRLRGLDVGVGLRAGWRLTAHNLWAIRPRSLSLALGPTILPPRGAEKNRARVRANRKPTFPCKMRDRGRFARFVADATEAGDTVARW